MLKLLAILFFVVGLLMCFTIFLIVPGFWLIGLSALFFIASALSKRRRQSEDY